MVQNVLERLVNEWIHEPMFRQAMLVDPEGTIRQGGLQLDESAWSVVRCLDWSLPSEVLKLLLYKVGYSDAPQQEGAFSSFTAPETEEQQTVEWSIWEEIYRLYAGGLINTEQYSDLLKTLIQTA
jgi:hypothetical protein